MRITVLSGGESPEREVSLRSGAAVARALAEAGHTVRTLDPAESGFPQKLFASRPDCVFIALHGGMGEGGVMQGFLEIAGIPYTGSGPESSAICLNKLAAKRVLSSCGLSTPPFQTIEGSVRRSPFGMPVVVKPARLGSTFGISIVRRQSDLAPAVRRARRYDRDVFLEKFIDGTEITVGILGNEHPRVLPAIEIHTPGGFYDYRAKYTPGRSIHLIPPRLPEPVVARAAEEARKAFCCLCCSGMARMEMIVDNNGTPFILDVNTIPGFTETSLFPEAAASAGIPFPALCDTIVALGIQRWRKDRRERASGKTNAAGKGAGR